MFEAANGNGMNCRSLATAGHGPDEWIGADSFGWSGGHLVRCPCAYQYTDTTISMLTLIAGPSFKQSLDGDGYPFAQAEYSD